MIKLAIAAVMVSFVTVSLYGADTDQVVLRGLSVYGLDNEDAMPVVGDSLHPYITIQFDIAAAHPPELKIRFLHCSRDWVPDEGAFIQDDRFNTSFVLAFHPSPGGVEHYAYRYVNRFPDSGGVVQFTYSGNWIFRIFGEQETEVLGEGRFFVVEHLVKLSVKVRNAYQTSLASPFNQVHRVDVHVSLPDETEGMFYTAVDVYQNRRFHSPWKIDAWDRDPYTTVEGFGSGERTFSVLNIPPGNEYRILDIGNANRYPNRDTVRRAEGPDLPRMLWRTGPDHDGTSRTRRFAGIHSDYLPVEFRLEVPVSGRMAEGDRQVFLAGSFNAWNPGPGDLLLPDAQESALVSVQLLRRGIYDYQYVTGTWDEGLGVVRDQDWLELEGNDWRTTNTYAAFVYYRDSRFGGFDRLAGYAITRSSGEAGASY